MGMIHSSRGRRTIDKLEEIVRSHMFLQPVAESGTDDRVHIFRIVPHAGHRDAGSLGYLADRAKLTEEFESLAARLSAERAALPHTQRIDQTQRIDVVLDLSAVKSLNTSEDSLPFKRFHDRVQDLANVVLVGLSPDAKTSFRMSLGRTAQGLIRDQTLEQWQELRAQRHIAD